MYVNLMRVDVLHHSREYLSSCEDLETFMYLSMSAHKIDSMFRPYKSQSPDLQEEYKRLCRVRIFFLLFSDSLVT